MEGSPCKQSPASQVPSPAIQVANKEEALGSGLAEELAGLAGSGTGLDEPEDCSNEENTTEDEKRSTWQPESQHPTNTTNLNMLAAKAGPSRVHVKRPQPATTTPPALTENKKTGNHNRKSGARPASSPQLAGESAPGREESVKVDYFHRSLLWDFLTYAQFIMRQVFCRVRPMGSAVGDGKGSQKPCVCVQNEQLVIDTTEHPHYSGAKVCVFVYVHLSLCACGCVCIFM